MMATITAVQCLRCHARYEAIRPHEGCPKCLEENRAVNTPVVYGDGSVAERGKALFGQADAFAKARRGIWRWAPLLPDVGSAALSLGEGHTPVFRAADLDEDLGGPIWVKDESRNPTWSHKDRMSAVGLAVAKARGAQVVAVASSGNQGASVAAYGAAHGLTVLVVTTPGVSPAMAQLIRAYDGRLVFTKTSPERWQLIARGVKERGWFPMGNYTPHVLGAHPFALEGYKTAAYEIYEQFDGDLPGWIVCPVAYGDILYGLYRGFCDLEEMGLIRSLPRLLAVERFGSLTEAWQANTDILPAVKTESTAAKSIANATSTYHALHALRASKGAAVTVDEPRVVSSTRWLPGQSGLFAESSSAAAFAGLRKARQQGLVPEGEAALIIMTSTALKDTSLFSAGGSPEPVDPASVSLDALVSSEAVGSA